jgi:(S)-3,5-dihydroxyphenylglycine transaminase
LIEDNPYGMFNYGKEKLPTLKALDKEATVIYIGSFSKTIFPGLRLGYLVADQQVEHGRDVLAKELSKVKSLITVNTSTLLQAMVGGILLQNNLSLQDFVRPKVAALRRNRDVMLECLAKQFRDCSGGVQWNSPDGGFFLTMKLPFPFGPEELEECARDYGVIVCPMQFFSLGQGRECQIRLAFSYVDEEQIHEGIGRLARFIHARAAMAGMRAQNGIGSPA